MNFFDGFRCFQEKSRRPQRVIEVEAGKLELGGQTAIEDETSLLFQERLNGITGWVHIGIN